MASFEAIDLLFNVVSVLIGLSSIILFDYVALTEDIFYFYSKKI